MAPGHDGQGPCRVKVEQSLILAGRGKANVSAATRDRRLLSARPGQGTMAW